VRVLLCADGAALDQLLDRALAYVAQPAEWLAVHVVDTRGRVELGLLRAGIPGAGPLGPHQRAEIEAASSERGQMVLGGVEAAIRARGLASGGIFQRLGEPRREICALAQAERVDLIVLLAKRRPGPAGGPPSVGHTARFVLDHAPCPVLLLRGTR
jgi:nucleotide-binding universal stress UspA family protein